MVDLLSCLSSDVRMIVCRMVFDDTYRSVREQFKELFVPTWDDKLSYYKLGHRPVASWRPWDEQYQSITIYNDIWRVARKEPQTHIVCNLHKDYYYRECFY